MKKLSIIIVLCLAVVASAEAGLFDDFLKEVTKPHDEQGGSLSEGTIIDGLKEALTVSTRNAVGNVSQVDGYFGNPVIKIPFPENIRKVADTLSTVGFKEQVDDFVLSMNRAAEKAAPEAIDIFVGAIKEMTIADARGILDGGDTAATDYFKDKTFDRLYDKFKPPVSESMDKVGVTKSYKNLMGRYTALPFVKAEDYDLDHYVTTKALDGLFYMLGEEEKKIRKDPAARVTELLKKVFGR